LILDHEPYRAIYDVSEPVLYEDLSPGAHVLFAFPSRAWHESVKSEGALAVRRFTVGGGGGAAAAGAAADFDPGAPFLVYSRPKGTYVGADADSVMVDFYLGNTRLGPDAHTVRLTVDDVLEAPLTAWVPHFLVGLPAGEHRIRLELLNAAGAPVGGSFARAEAAITVER
ncbi:MAG: hypothetical protein RRA92_07930, partial [Gemmatimonadota bacterium]|nr:hypothetical protein [Gemmatimonadota bacterium]